MADKKSIMQTSIFLVNPFLFTSTAVNCMISPPTLSGPLRMTSQGMGEKIVPSVFPGTPILELGKLSTK